MTFLETIFFVLNIPSHNIYDIKDKANTLSDAAKEASISIDKLSDSFSLMPREVILNEKQQQTILSQVGDDYIALLKQEDNLPIAFIKTTNINIDDFKNKGTLSEAGIYASKKANKLKTEIKDCRNNLKEVIDNRFNNLDVVKY